ncbi:MAG: hypothetical protein IPN90_00345 [Elusimicrobia bacterium]|nr:hypothetical protein [Elusimicrobiota bacterium]
MFQNRYKSILDGGGLRRSVGGWEGVRALKMDEDVWQIDARILGDGGFVSEVQVASEEKLSLKERLKGECHTLRCLAQIARTRPILAHWEWRLNAV